MRVVRLRNLLTLGGAAGLLLSLAMAALPHAISAGAPAQQDLSTGTYQDTMQLTDEPGNWFKSELTGTPVAIINQGRRVKFEIGNQTNTKHTVTLLLKPPGSSLEVDQDDAVRGGIGVTFDKPGVYLFTCKVHPYMQGVVAVKTAQGTVPPVTPQQLPFIGHLGGASLQAETVLSVLTNIAPTDADKRAKWDIFGPADESKPTVPGVGEVWVGARQQRRQDAQLQAWLVDREHRRSEWDR